MTTSEATATPASADLSAETPALPLPADNSRPAALQLLASEAPRLLAFIDAVEAGDVDAVLDLLTFHRLLCQERQPDFPYELCERHGGTIPLDVFAVDPGTGAEWYQRSELAEWLKKALRGPERSLQFVARTSDGSYSLGFFIEPTLDRGPRPILVLWFELPAEPPAIVHGDDGRYAEFLLRVVTHAFFDIIRFDAAVTYEVLWASDPVLEAERAFQEAISRP